MNVHQKQIEDTKKQNLIEKLNLENYKKNLQNLFTINQINNNISEMLNYGLFADTATV